MKSRVSIKVCSWKYILINRKIWYYFLWKRAGEQTKYDQGDLGSDRKREGSRMEAEERSTIAETTITVGVTSLISWWTSLTITNGGGIDK